MLEENLLISKGTSVGAGTVITNSVIGRNCTIGKDKNLMCDLLLNLLITEHSYQKALVLCHPQDVEIIYFRRCRVFWKPCLFSGQRKIGLLHLHED